MERDRKPSAIILGTKRSGSNFTHDVLSYAYESAIQEPLGLHNEGPMSFTLNPLNPWRYSSIQHVSSEYGHTELKSDPYGLLLTRNFISWLNVRSSADIHSYLNVLTQTEVADIRSIFKEFGIRLDKSPLDEISSLVTWDRELENKEQQCRVIQKTRTEIVKEIQGQTVKINEEYMIQLGTLACGLIL